jgi:hypothetical protein
VREVDVILGYVPVHLTPDDSLFIIHVFRNERAGWAAVYLRVRGPGLTAEGLVSALRGKPGGAAAEKAVVLEAASVWTVVSDSVAIYP